MLVKNKKIQHFVALCLGVMSLILGISYGRFNLDTTMKAPADGSLVIKVDKFGYEPFDAMTIKGAGFDKDAATSVIFHTVYYGETLVVPALEVTDNSVTVAVPPVDYEETNKSFNQDSVSIMVVQMEKVEDKLVVKSSNKSDYFVIYKPTLPSAYQKIAPVPTGTATQLVMAVAVQSLKSANAKIATTNPKLTAALAKSQKETEQMMANIEKIKKNPKAVVALTMSNGKTVNFGIEDVIRLDAFYSGYLGVMEKRYAWLATNQSPISTFVENAHAAGSCQTDVMNGPYSFLHFDSVAGTLCNVIEYQRDPKEKESNWNKLGYVAQIPITIVMSPELGKGIGTAMPKEWLLPRHIMVATALSMASDLVLEGKIPDDSSFYPIAQTLVAEYVDKNITTEILGKTLFADVLTAVATYDLITKIVTNKEGQVFGTNVILLDSNSIIKNTYDILKDTTKNPENLLFLGRAIKNGVLMPFTYLRAEVPDDSTVEELAPIGVQKGGYSNAGGEPITQTKPVPKTTPASSPVPTSKEEIIEIIPGTHTEPVLLPEPSQQEPTVLIPEFVKPEPLPESVVVPETPSCIDLVDAEYDRCNASCPPERTQAEIDTCYAACEPLYVQRLNSWADCTNVCVKMRMEHANCDNPCRSAQVRGYSICN